MGHETRSMTRGDCEVHGRRTAFGQNVLSIKGCQFWNELPAFLREIPTFPAFKGQLKQWLKDNQSCEHTVIFFRLAISLVSVILYCMSKVLYSLYVLCEDNR